MVSLCRDLSGVYSGHLAHAERLENVRIARVPGVGTARFAQSIRPDRVVRALLHADAIHLHDLRFSFAEAALVAAARRIPLFVHTHGLFYHTPHYRIVKDLILRHYFGRGIQASGALVLASSASDRDRLLEVVPRLAARTRLFPNAIDLSPLLAASPKPTPGLVVIHGRVVRSKRIDTAIAALAALGRRDVRLTIAGTPDESEVALLRAVARAHRVESQVSILGEFEPDQLPTLLARADLALFPSPAEGFGLALLEALSAGVPLVANDNPAHREVLGVGLQGLVADFRDPHRVAQVMERLLSLEPSDRSRLTGALRERARTFDISQRLSQLSELYQERGLRWVPKSGEPVETNHRHFSEQ